MKTSYVVKCDPGTYGSGLTVGATLMGGGAGTSASFPEMGPAIVVQTTDPTSPGTDPGTDPGTNPGTNPRNRWRNRIARLVEWWPRFPQRPVRFELGESCETAGRDCRSLGPPRLFGDRVFKPSGAQPNSIEVLISSTWLEVCMFVVSVNWFAKLTR